MCANVVEKGKQSFYTGALIKSTYVMLLSLSFEFSHISSLTIGWESIKRYQYHFVSSHLHYVVERANFINMINNEHR
jgi:hypothetical protein